jgi:hypothetical protein
MLPQERFSRLLQCLDTKLESSGETQHSTAAQPVLQGCFWFFADAPVRAWYEPTSVFGGTLLLGSIEANYTGSYAGFPTLVSAGWADTDFGVWSVFSIGPFAVLFRGATFGWFGFWVDPCDLPPNS